MKVLIAIVAALAAVTFPIYFVIFMFKALVLCLMTLMASVFWMFSQLFQKLGISGKSNKPKNVKLLGR